MFIIILCRQFIIKFMLNSVKNLLSVLSLRDVGARTLEHIFTGISQQQPNGRVFGGQVLAQSIIAAAKNVPEKRHIHSMHGYFLRPGDANLPITFSVDTLRDGRSFSTRRTQAFQNGLPIFSMIASFQTQDLGLDHQRVLVENVEPAENLPQTLDVLKQENKIFFQDLLNEVAFDIRHSPSPIFFESGEIVQPNQYVWMKLKDKFPPEQILHQAALAYVSDFTILEPVLRNHKLSWNTAGIKVASLDHAMWWHREVKVDEWLLFIQQSPNAIGGRGLSQGYIYDAKGILVASVAQEGMIRL